MAAQRFRGRHGAGGEPSEPPETRAKGGKKKNLREDLRRTEPFCFPARGSLRPRLAQAHRSLRPHASTHGSGRGSPEYAPTVRGFPAAEHRPQRAHRLGGHRRCLTACLGSSITPCAARPPRSRGRISFPPRSLQHPPRTHTPGTSRGWGTAAPRCRPHGPGAPPPARQMVNYIHSRILRWDRVSDNEPVLFD